MKIQTANQLSGRVTGALFFAFFGALWIALALYALERLSVTTVSGVVLGLAILLLGAVHLLRLAKRWPRVPDDPAVGRVFAWINAVQWIAVAVVAYTLARLHMFPLARIFRYAPHYWSGAVLVLWAATSALLVPIVHLQGVSALGTGVILWLNAAATLALAWSATRQPTEQLA